MLVVGADAPLAAVAAAVAGGVDRVQVRERGLGGRALLSWVEAVAGAIRDGAGRRSPDAREPGREAAGRVELVVNRRVDVALAVDADGVHLGFDALDAARARALVGPGRLVGVSMHAPEEAADAARAGADYVHLAPIFAPLSKPAARPALGVAALGAAARTAGIEVIAQGGIEATNVRAVLAAGAAGVAVTGAVLGAGDPGAAARRLRAALDAAGEDAS